MKTATNKLSSRQIEAFKYTEKPVKLFDGGGLFLHVTKTGKYWRLKYRHLGKEKVLSIGPFPMVSLQAARKRRDESRRLLQQGVDPFAHKRAEVRQRGISEANTFEKIAYEWYEQVHKHKVTLGHSKRNLERLQKYVFPKIGNYPINEITPPILLEVLRELENRGIIETAQRVKSLCSQVFRYGVATMRAQRDPAADLKGILRTSPEKHLPAITDPKEIGPLLRAIDAYPGHPSVCNALKLAPYLFCRPNELRQMKWGDLDLEDKIWNYQPSKGGLPLQTQLPFQAVEILTEQRHLSSSSVFVFPSIRTLARPISNGTLSAALARLDYRGTMTVHGFRAMARTILAERLAFPVEVIEMQLGHNVKDTLGRAYNRTTFLKQRGEMLQTWADYLDGLREGNQNNVFAIRR
jgi:integrase